jgi:hypothetical protein
MADFDVYPTDDDVAFFAENGFLVVERLTTDEELAHFTEIFEKAMSSGRAFEPGRDRGDEGQSQLDQLIAPELDYDAVGAWLPLHDVSVERGAMQFIPGSHKGPLLQHVHVGDPIGNLLVADGVDSTAAVACPLPAGGATFHHHRTLHFTAANTTDQARLAFPMEFQVRPRLRAEPRSTPWVDVFRAATAQSGGPPIYIADGQIVVAT